MIDLLLKSIPIFHNFLSKQAAKDVGITSITKNYPSSITENELMEILAQLNNDDSVDGILVQLPLPEHISERKVSLVV